MPACIIAGCPHEANGRLKTCALCRASMHRWEKRRLSEIVDRAHQLDLYRNRMSQFAAVKDDEAQLIDRALLERNGVMMFRATKRKTKATILHLKKRRA